ncbi:hypothetical protein PMAYCL1PPCAC_08725, partial [Pristionchus mayeri]
QLLVAAYSGLQVARVAVALRSLRDLRSLHSHRASAQSPPMERSHCRIRRLIILQLGECNLRPACLRAAEGVLLTEVRKEHAHLLLARVHRRPDLDPALFRQKQH